MKHTPILLPVLLTVSLAFGGRAALADSPDRDVRSEAVRYGDLDLTSPSGVRTLDRRIDQAITRVCNRGDVRDLQSSMEERRCRSNARHAANTQRGQALASANPGPIQLSGRH